MAVASRPAVERAPTADLDVPPLKMAAIYGLMSIGLIVTALTTRVLSGFTGLLAAIAYHRGICQAVVFTQVLFAIGLASAAFDLTPAVAAALLIFGSANVGIGITLMTVKFANSFVAPLLVAAGAHALLALWVGLSRRNIEDLGPALFIAVAGMLLSFLVGVGWWHDVPAFFGMSAVTLFLALLNAWGSAQFRLIMTARNPEKPPVNTIAGALALSLGCLLYFWQMFPTQYGYNRRN